MIIKILHLILGVRFFIFMGVMCRTTIRDNRAVQFCGIHYCSIEQIYTESGENYFSNYQN